MRLWHKDLIDVLPKQQLLGQWRECCCIARNIAVNGTPNHILVNKIMDYSADHFFTYAKLIEEEMKRRGYKCNFDNFLHWYGVHHFVYHDELFRGWHNIRYLFQCFRNLEEKYDCGGIASKEFDLIWEKYCQAIMS